MEKILTWFVYTDIYMYPCLLVMIWLISVFTRLRAGERNAALAILIYCISDLACSIIAYNGAHNIWLYNLMLIPQFFMVVYSLASSISSLLIRRILYSGTFMILVLHCINLFYYQGLHDFNSFTYIPAMAWMATAAYFFLREQFNEVAIHPFSYFISWYAIATLIDNAGSMPVLSILGWAEYTQSEQGLKLLGVVTLLYTLWYLIILTGLLWTRISLRSASRYR